MITIYKYPIPAGNGEFGHVMPERAKILTVQTQKNVGHLWALIDTDRADQVRKFSTRGTGHLADNLGAYIGSYQIDGGNLVFHIFDCGPDPIETKRLKDAEQSATEVRT